MFVNIVKKFKVLKLSHVLYVFSVILIISIIAINFRMTSRMISIDFKVYGRVQGVFFRKFTKQKAVELGLFGWVKNARDGTVVGTAQGLEDQINIMKDWLTRTGSPYSKIDRCRVTNERQITALEFNDFEVRH